MWSTEGKAKVKRQKAKEGACAARRASARLLLVFCLLPFAFLLSGCRMDMQDQPKYKTFRAGDKKFFPDGASVRAPVEGTVARQFGDYRDRDDYFFTGKTAQSASGGAQAGGIALDADGDHRRGPRLEGADDAAQPLLPGAEDDDGVAGARARQRSRPAQAVGEG